jgi:hypothetical protein
MLLQAGGLGGPYFAASASGFITTIGLDPTAPFIWGINPPADAGSDQILAANMSLPTGGPLLFNLYANDAGSWSHLASGPGAALSMDGSGNIVFDAAPTATAGTVAGTLTQPLVLSPAGHLTLGDTLTVARDPTAPLEVATMGYVTAHTVASWNGRIGAVTLTLADITGAGGAPIASPDFTGIPTAPTPTAGDDSTKIATTEFVYAAIAAVSPDVHSFNGRSGVVTFLTADFNAATAVLTDPPPTAPTAPTTDISEQLATTAFVHAALAVGAVTSWNGRVGAVTMTMADITAAGGAPIDSPAFTGLPNAPTAVPGTSTGQLATTAFVVAAVAAATTGVSSWNGRTGAVVLNQSDIVNASGWASPSFTGVPLAPTAATATNTTQIATTAFVHAAVASATAGVSSWNTRTGDVVLTLADVTGVGGAALASPAFTGTPTANTAVPGTATTQLATTAFVAAALGAISTGVTSFNTRTGAITLQGNDVSAAGGALLDSPTFIGVPTAPTATTGDSSFQLATTQFVSDAIAAGVAGVSSWNGRGGNVVMVTADITAAGGAPVASPTLTGVPLAPTATAGTSTQQLATTAFVHTAIAAVPAGVTSFNTRTGAITLTAADITAAGGMAAADVAAAYVSFATAQTLTAPQQLQARTNVNSQVNLGFTPVNKAGDTMTGDLIVNAASTQIRIINSNYGVMLHQDGTNLYFLITASGDPTGSWNNLRPFMMNLSTGNITSNNTITSVNGRLWGTNDFSAPVTSVRLTYGADYNHAGNSGLAEPYAGAVHTGASGVAGMGGSFTIRYRFLQFLISGGWYTAGYA